MASEDLKNKFSKFRDEWKKKKDTGYSKQSSYKPSKVWKATYVSEDGKKGVTNYTIRFIPDMNHGDEIPWVKYKIHYIKFPSGKQLYVPCLYTLKKNCPVCKFASKMWSSTNPVDKEIAKKLFSKDRYVSNVYIVEDHRKDDSGNLLFQGKTFLFEYGDKIFKKLEAALIEDELDFYSFAHGINFKLKLSKQGDFNNYDASEFERKETPLSEQLIADVTKNCFDLEKEYMTDTFFHSEKELQKIVDAFANGDDVDTDNEEKETVSTEEDTQGEATADRDEELTEEEIEDDIKQEQEEEVKKIAKQVNEEINDEEGDEEFNADEIDEDFDFDFNGVKEDEKKPAPKKSKK